LQTVSYAQCRAMSDESRDRPILLSAARASPSQRRTAVIVGLIVLVAFVATAPIAQVKLVSFPGTILLQNSLAFLSDAITASLLFGQYSVNRSRALCILAFGYLFTALMAASHALSYPEVFSAAGLFNGTPWLYPAWHAVLPLTVIAFALRPPDEYSRLAVHNVLVPIIFTILSAGCLALACTWLIATGDAWLPLLVQDGRLLPASRFVIAVLLLMPLSALLMLVIRKSLSMLDIWLAVVMFTWLCTISLVALVSAERYDAGWYAGRIFEVLTSLFVLVALLSETIGLYAHNIRTAAVERRERERRLNEMEAVLIHVSRVNELGQHVSTLIHEITQPLAAISMLA
jgi:two-component system, sensor histidine kinase and response regulator